jgi:hypothetical protein
MPITLDPTLFPNSTTGDVPLVSLAPHAFATPTVRIVHVQLADGVANDLGVVFQRVVVSVTVNLEVRRQASEEIRSRIFDIKFETGLLSEDRFVVYDDIDWPLMWSWIWPYVTKVSMELQASFAQEINLREADQSQPFVPHWAP